MDVQYIQETQVTHEHVCGFDVSLCFVFFLVVDGGLYLFAAIFSR